MACVKYFLSEKKPGIDPKALKLIIKTALSEDIGKKDITTELTIPKNRNIKAKILAKESFLLCGMPVAKNVFKTVDASLKFSQIAKEGRQVKANDTLAVISGKAASILTAERVALNFLSLLSGIATKTSRFVKKIHPFKTKITDTRKTIAGIRQLQKYAVRIGGGHNHRMRLDEMFLIKDNHLKIIGGYPRLLKIPKKYRLEIEAQNLKEFEQALELKPDIIMLDNMKIPEIKKAVKIRGSLPVLLEASGGMHFGNVKKFAALGVDVISCGELTDSLKSVDVCLEIA